MDAEKSFAFPFEDRDWLSKLGLGAMINLIPVLNFAWSGYLVGIIRNVIHDNPEPLPTWDDIGKKFSEGLILFAASLIYASPVLIALCLPLGIGVFSGLLSGNSNMQDIEVRVTQSEAVLFVGLLCVFLLYGLGLSILYPAVLLMFSREGTFASCFKLGQIFDLIRKNAAEFFTAWGWSLVASIGVGLLVGFVNMVVGVVPCIGWLIGLVLSLSSGVYASAVYAHLFGQFGRAAFQQGGPVPAAPGENPSTHLGGQSGQAAD